MNKAKNLFLYFIVLACFVLVPVVSALGESGFTMSDVTLATDEELDNALQQIVAEQRSRLKTRITLSSSEITLVKGKTAKLTAAVEDLPEGVSAGKIEWSTDNPDIATVQNGTIKGVNAGSTTVHSKSVLSDGMEIITDCKVTVNIPVSQIIYNKPSFTMKVGETYTPTFGFKPENATDTSLSFETSDAAVATVENGTITALSAGNVKITAKTNDGSDKKMVLSIKVVQTFSQELIPFDSRMMQSVSSQINEATDLTISGSNRAVLAALLTLEYQYQCPSSKIDFTKPLLVSKSGTMAAAVFAVQDDYVMVIYQMHPLSTSYCYLGDSDAAMAKAALEMVSDDVWTVPLSEYNQKLKLLIQQIQGQ